MVALHETMTSCADWRAMCEVLRSEGTVTIGVGSWGDCTVGWNNTGYSKCLNCYLESVARTPFSGCLVEEHSLTLPIFDPFSCCKFFPLGFLFQLWTWHCSRENRCPWRQRNLEVIPKQRMPVWFLSAPTARKKTYNGAHICALLFKRYSFEVQCLD